MSSDPLESNSSVADGQLLADLMGPDEAHTKWQPNELGQILRHQLRAPLLFDLSTVAVQENLTLQQDACMCLGNFGALFQDPRPPLDLLRLTKQFAKAKDAGERLLPREVATVIYYAAIICAQLRHGQSISKLSDKQLRAGIDWVLQRTWLDESLRPLFAEAQAMFNRESPEAD